MRSADFGVPPLNISKVSPSHASHETEQIKLAPVQDNVDCSTYLVYVY